MKDLTICILAYNAEKYIQQTLESLEVQESTAQILIVVDGASDGTEAICRDCAKKSNKKIEIHTFEENHGTAYCRNWALENATTEFMMFFDSDDIAKKELVKILHDTIIKDDNCIAVSCQAKYIDEAGNKLPGGMYFQMPDKDSFVKRAREGKFMFMLPATIFRREYALRAGGYRQDGFPVGEIRYQDLSEDLDLWSRMSDFYSDEKYMIIIPKTLYYYRKRVGSLSATKEQQFAMSLKMKFIKCNLKRRRAGESEITFTEFLAQRTTWEKFNEKRCFYSEYYYRQSAFAFAGHNYAKAIMCLPISVILNPKYLFQKIVSNIGNK